MTMPTYVVATDLSHTSRHGARIASELALATDGCMDLLCAIPTNVSDDMERFCDAVVEGLDDFASRYRKKNVKVNLHAVVAPDPEKAILHHLRKVGAAMLIVAPRGVTGAKRLLLGSMTERLIRSCPTRLLVARRAPKRDDSRVLIAVDGSPGSARALRAGLALCAARDATPIVVNVIPAPSSWVNVEEALAGTNSYKSSKARKLRAQPAIEAWVGRYVRKNHRPVELHVREGGAADEILAQARASNAGMIVVGTQSKSRIQELFVGSVARAVATHATASVLLVRSTPPRPQRVKASGGTKRKKPTKPVPRKRSAPSRRQKVKAS